MFKKIPEFRLGEFKVTHKISDRLIFRVKDENGADFVLKSPEIIGGIKVNQSCSSKSLVVDQYLREKMLLSNFSHPNISETKQVFLSGKEFLLTPYYGKNGKELIQSLVRKDFQEVLESKTFFENIKHPLVYYKDKLKRDSWLEFVLKGMADIGHALMYIHSEGYVHRDVKPANVILSDKSILIDYGLCSLIGTEIRGISGSPSYMAPDEVHKERFFGVKKVVPAQDLFSYCVTISNLLTLDVPTVAAKDFKGLVQYDFYKDCKIIPKLVKRGMVCNPSSWPNLDDLVGSLEDRLRRG